MFDDYKRELLEFYHKKKTSNQLSDNLESPTQAKLRKECLSILKSRPLKKDDETIKAFFDPDGRFNDHILSIEKFDLDGFKAMLKFFLGKSAIRKDENIKLLAWLIDFESYKDWRARKEQPLIDTNSGGEGGGKNTGGGEGGPDKPKPPMPIQNLIISCIIVVVMISGAFLFWKDKMDREAVTKDEKCMQWKGDHYEAIACNQISGTSKVALDIQKLNHFKEITTSDTLTTKDLGKTWYIKINGRMEFYTDSGMHPIDSLKRLKPVTPYILNKYVSYYRYLLIRLIWSISVIVFLILIVWLGKYLRKQNRIKYSATGSSFNRIS